MPSKYSLTASVVEQLNAHNAVWKYESRADALTIHIDPTHGAENSEEFEIKDFGGKVRFLRSIVHAYKGSSSLSFSTIEQLGRIEDFRYESKGFPGMNSKADTLIIDRGLSSELDFPGDVALRGKVVKGGKLSCKKLVALYSSVEGGEVHINGDAEVFNISGTGSLVLCEGNLACRFIENGARVTAKNIVPVNSPIFDDNYSIKEIPIIRAVGTGAQPPIVNVKGDLILPSCIIIDGTVTVDGKAEIGFIFGSKASLTANSVSTGYAGYSDLALDALHRIFRSGSDFSSIGKGVPAIHATKGGVTVKDAAHGCTITACNPEFLESGTINIIGSVGGTSRLFATGKVEIDPEKQIPSSVMIRENVSPENIATGLPTRNR